MEFGDISADVYLPWAAGASSSTQVLLPALGNLSDACSLAPSSALARIPGFVGITAVLHGSAGNKAMRSVSLAVPQQLSCAELKGYLAVEGVVSTCGDLGVSLEESSPCFDDCDTLDLTEGQVVHLRRATSMVHITVLSTAATPSALAVSDEEVFELVLPSEMDGCTLKARIQESTSGALVPHAVYLADGDDIDAAPFAVADDQLVRLSDDQVIIAQKQPQPVESMSAPEPVEVAPAANSTKSSGFFAGLKQRLLGTQQVKDVAPTTALRVRCASNVKVKGSDISATSTSPWSGCVVYDVPSPSYFEITVQLLADAPLAEAQELAGRWMLGVVPSAVAEVKTEKQQKLMMGLGYFITVCHGHPAKVHAPSMPRGTCGEDCPALSGELHKGQTLTLRWAAEQNGGTLSASIDDAEAITLPYAPALFDDVRPCIVLGGKPTELRILQLDMAGSLLGGA